MSSQGLNRLILDPDLKRTSQHYVAIGERSDLWPGEYKNKQVAIKVLRGTSPGNQAFLDQLKNHLYKDGEIWCQLNHPNVSQFYGFSFEFGYMPALIMPYYPNGNIVRYLQANPQKDTKDKLTLVMGISRGLEYLHTYNPPIIHGDIRGANILIDTEGQPRLCDAGLVFILKDSEFTSGNTGGNCRWIAPEVLNPPEEIDDISNMEAPFTQESDIYAFSMTILEIITGQIPFRNYRNDSSVIFAIIRGERPELPDFIKQLPGLQDIITRCWLEDPKARPTARHVCNDLQAYALKDIQASRWIHRLYNNIMSLFVGVGKSQS